MTTPSESTCAWSASTIERLNSLFGVRHDADISVEDWPSAMAMPSLVDAALKAYDRTDATPDERALIVELLLNTFEFSSIERDGNPDWRRALDRLERDFVEHQVVIHRWAEPDDDNPWLISDELQALRKRVHSSR